VLSGSSFCRFCCVVCFEVSYILKFFDFGRCNSDRWCWLSSANVSVDMDTVVFACWAGVQCWFHYHGLFDFVICNLKLQVPLRSRCELEGVRLC
jgi:hypothetical protein